jgi:hypothetical protein
MARPPHRELAAAGIASCGACQYAYHGTVTITGAKVVTGPQTEFGSARRRRTATS